MFSARKAALGAAMLFLIGLVIGPGASRAHEGHDHGAEEQPAAPAHVLPRGEAASEAFQIVAIAHNGELAIYLDRFASNEPVADAAIAVETPEGPAEAIAAPDGTYRLKAPWLTAGGHLDLIFTVTAGSEVDVLPLTLNLPQPAGGAAENGGTAAPTMLERAGAFAQPALLAALGAGFLLGMLFASLRRGRAAAAIVACLLGALLALPPHPATAADAPLAERAQRQPDGTIFAPKPVQRIFGIRTELAARRSVRRMAEWPGRIIADPNASGHVQTAVGGRLSPPPGGFPRLGQAVKAGDILAYVTPPLQAIDVSDMRQRQGELDQQIAIVERRLARYEQLVASGAMARTQFEETRLELQGLQDRRASLDRARRDPEALVAPVPGVIAEGAPVAGQIAQTNAVIYQIVDPARLWVEALSFDAVGRIGNASALLPDGKALTLQFRGAGFSDRSQAVPIHFAIEGDTNGLRAGQLVSVFAATGEEQDGIALTRSAVVRAANGQDFVLEQMSAERFVPRPVRVAPLDGERVLVLSGIESGKRVVVAGAELLDHVR